MIILKKTACILLVLAAFLSISVGYAALTDNMFIYGDAEVAGKPFVGVYIYSIELVRESGANEVSHTFFKPTNFSNVAHPAWEGGSLTYKITLHNNSEITYWYIGEEHLSGIESNDLIGVEGGITITTKDHYGDTGATFDNDDWIPPETYRDVYLTITYGENAQIYPSIIINLLFGVKMDSVQDQFLYALNNHGFNSYEYITEYFDEKYEQTGETVIANVGEEKEFFDTLFGENLTVNVDGVDVPVTVMISRDNMDGRVTGDSYAGGGAPTGCEYTVYITIDPLDSPTGEALVYAVSYSRGGVGGDGELWYQLGQLYEGTADIIDYDTVTPGMQGAFNIESWEATPNRYVAADGITYLVGQEQGDQYDKLKTLKEIMSTNDQDIFNDIDNTRILKKVYDIVYNGENSSKPGYMALREVFIEAEPFYAVYNGGQEVKVRRNCTRAEILPYLEHIQKALDYYNEVN